MLRHKAESILVIILIPILAYVAWQAYNTYFKPQTMDIEGLEETGTEEQPPAPPPPGKKEAPVEIKGTLDYTGYTGRDPLRPSLPVREKIEKKPKPPKPVEGPKEKKPEKPKKEPPKEIILPTFTVTGIVWGKAQPRAIIDRRVYKTGDIVKGAKILDITQKGIYMIYEEKEFWVTISR